MIQCPACQSHKLEFLFDMGRQPMSLVSLQDDCLKSCELPRYEIKLAICRNCTHVFNTCYNNHVVDYSGESCRMYNSGSGWQDHLNDVRKMIQRLPVDLIVEVGAGDCEFLNSIDTEALKLAVDPCKAVTRASKYGINYFRQLFDPDQHLPCDNSTTLVIMRHLLEHMPQPRELIEAISIKARQRKMSTFVYIEVPCCENALARGRIEDWTYEHPQHFTAGSMRALLHNCGVGHLMVLKKYGGEVLSVLAKFDPVTHVDVDVDAAVIRYAEVDRGIEYASEWLKSHRDNVIFWGGAGKSAMFLQRLGIKKACVVDSHTEKWGLHVPGTSIPIQSPQMVRITPDDYIVATTSWRADDIRDEIIRSGIKCKALLKFENAELTEVPLG